MFRLPVIARKLMVSMSFFISAGIYFNAAMSERSETNDSAISNLTAASYLAFLAVFSGLYEASEIYDHLFPQHAEEEGDVSSEAEADAVDDPVYKYSLIAA